jgi:arsenate reductase
MNTPIRVLFLCTGNSARSIIAEALLRELGGDDFEVHSAGTRPKGLNPFTLTVLRQEGIDPSGFNSKSMSVYTNQSFDYVITVCDSAAEECPTFPGAPERIHWSFPDPAEAEGTDLEKLAAFQTTLREMRRRVAPFITVALRTGAR